MWHLPGPRRFLHRVAEAADEARIVRVYAPERGLPDGFRPALTQQFQTSWHVVTVAAAELADPLTRVERLAARLGIHVPTTKVAELPEIVRHPNAARRVIWVDRRGADDDQASWAGFVNDLARAQAGVPLAERLTAISVEIGSSAALEQPVEFGVAAEWWWGCLTRLDTQVYVAESSLPARAMADAALLAGIVELAQFDLRLCDQLVDEWDGNAAAAARVVRKHGQTLQLDGVAAVSLERANEAAPAVPVLEHWRRGLIDYWDGQDLRQHVCLANALEREIERRLWNAQVRSVFPELELQRQRVARWINANRRLLAAADQGEDVFALEIGQLLRLIHRTPSLKVQSEWKRLAEWLRDARNALAHLKPLEASAIQRGDRLVSASE